MTYKFWLTSELKFLHQFIKTMPLSQIAKSLQRTEASVLRKAYELGIQPAQPVKRWSPAEIVALGLERFSEGQRVPAVWQWRSLASS